MTKDELMNLCKYYKGEAECPGKANKNYRLWWGGEKLFVDSCLDDSSFFARIKDTFDEAYAEGALSGFLIDMSIPKDKRVLIFFLDIWHGKWFPYDSYDVIFDY